MSGETLGKVRCPAHIRLRFLPNQCPQKVTPRLPCRALRQHIKTAVGRLQRRHFHIAFGQQRHPGPVRTQPCPAGTAQRQHHSARLHQGVVRRCGKAQRTLGAPALETVPHVELHALAAQPLQPGAQQGRSLEVGGKHAPRSADKGLHPQPLRPVAQLGRAEVLQQPSHHLLARAIACVEGLRWLGMGQVQPTFAGQQKLAPHARHGIEHLHAHTGIGQCFSGHQARRPGANDSGIAGRKNRRIKRGSGGHGAESNAWKGRKQKRLCYQGHSTLAHAGWGWAAASVTMIATLS